MKYDVFISHASEDKEPFVSGLASQLERIGVKVWYDKFALTAGDSLSRSIDLGLIDSKFGLVILSHAFFEKSWPEYELRSLISREMSEGKVIIPVWYDITKDDLLKYSPFLVDKLAVIADPTDLIRVAIEIVAAARPDIFQSIVRRQAYQEYLEANQVQRKVSELKMSGPRHENLPQKLLNRIFCIHEITKEFLSSSLENEIYNFRCDTKPEDEVEVWENICSAYLIAKADTRFKNTENKELFFFMLKASFGLSTEEENSLQKSKQNLLLIYKNSSPKIYEK